jgi:3-isopropylmalate dehydrogenase
VATCKVLVVPGDGIGPEVTREAIKIAKWLDSAGLMKFEFEDDIAGGAAIDAFGVPIRPETIELARQADAVLFGAVGGPAWDGKVPFEMRPELGVLTFRRELALFANLRPAKCFPALADASTLKSEVIQGLDIMIVRELTGGVYFNEPKLLQQLADGQESATDTQTYTTSEIQRVGRVAFELARQRRNKVTSVEKRNVMKSGVLWQKVLTQLHAEEYPDVQLEHHLADAAGMQLVRAPKQYDVMVMDNLFGDVLSDVAAMLTGSIGMLPSAALGAPDARTGKRHALYEPIHGSAPDIAGKNLANPIASVGSLSMALRYSFDRSTLADKLDRAIASVLAAGIRTGDIKAAGSTVVGTAGMGDAILRELQRECAAS